MPRRRMINPGVWTEPHFGSFTFRQRLLKFGLTTMSDDEGRFRANPALIRAQVFPYDELSLSDIESDLQAVAEAGYVMLYERDGERYGWEINWRKDQKPSHPSPSELPPPPVPLASVETKTPVLPFASGSGIIPESFANDSRAAPEQVSHGQSSVSSG